MEENNFDVNYTNFYDLNSSDNKSELFNENIGTIYENNSFNHYFCTKCHKFPFLKFCKDRKNVKLICPSFNNKKILIKNLFEILGIKDNILLSETNLNIEDEPICKEHIKKYKGFSKFFLNNYCEECFEYINEIYENDIIRFDDIKIEEKKIEELKRKVNNNNDIFDHNFNNDKSEGNTIKFYKINDSIYEKLSEEDEKEFKKLINIIISDYLNYPNFIHFINIKNLLHFFEIEDKKIEKEGNIIDDNLIEKKEPIIIEYINNISKKTKLFSKVFVKNNKEIFKMEIEGRRLYLIEKYEFKTKEKKVRKNYL